MAQQILHLPNRDRFVFGTLGNAPQYVEHIAPPPGVREKILIQGMDYGIINQTLHLFAENEFFNGRTIIHITYNQMKPSSQPNPLRASFGDGMRGRGIPEAAQKTFIPEYIRLGIRDRDKRDITGYLAPIYYINVSWLFELCKMNPNAGYASVFDNIIRSTLIEHPKDPIDQLYQRVDEIINDPDMRRMQWVYRMLLYKMRQFAQYALTNNEQSVLGEHLLHGIQTQTTQWVNLILPSDDDYFIVPILSEIFALQRQYPDWKLGIAIEELDVYTQHATKTLSFAAFKSLLTEWNMCKTWTAISGNPRQIPKALLDNSTNESAGLYTTIIESTFIPERGSLMYYNRAAGTDQMTPIRYERVKVMPPLASINLDYI